MLHAMLHAALASVLFTGKHHGITTLMSYSMWVSPTRIRVPDVVVVNDHLRESIRITPPLLCAEVIAPEDTLHNLTQRCLDFHKMGVPQTWLFDPENRVAYTYIDGLKLVQTPTLTLPNTPIYLDLPELFASLD